MKHVAVHLKLVAVAAIWGLGWPAGRVVASNVEPISGAWLRYILVVAMFLGYLKSTGRWMTPSDPLLLGGQPATQWRSLASTNDLEIPSLFPGRCQGETSGRGP